MVSRVHTWAIQDSKLELLVPGWWPEPGLGGRPRPWLPETLSPWRGGSGGPVLSESCRPQGLFLRNLQNPLLETRPGGPGKQEALGGRIQKRLSRPHTGSGAAAPRPRLHMAPHTPPLRPPPSSPHWGRKGRHGLCRGLPLSPGLSFLPRPHPSRGHPCTPPFFLCVLSPPRALTPRAHPALPGPCTPLTAGPCLSPVPCPHPPPRAAGPRVSRVRASGRQPGGGVRGCGFPFLRIPVSCVYPAGQRGSCAGAREGGPAGPKETWGGGGGLSWPPAGGLIQDPSGRLWQRPLPPNATPETPPCPIRADSETLWGCRAGEGLARAGGGDSI